MRIEALLGIIVWSVVHWILLTVSYLMIPGYYKINDGKACQLKWLLGIKPTMPIISWNNVFFQTYPIFSSIVAFFITILTYFGFIPVYEELHLEWLKIWYVLYIVWVIVWQVVWRLVNKTPLT